MKKDVPPQILNKIMNEGYEDLIVDLFMANEENDDYEISDIPMSPKIMKNSNEQVIMSQKVFDTYLKLVQRISNPETAEEIPFFLLGNSKVVDGKRIVEYEDIIYDIKGALSETRVSTDGNKFNELLKDERYNVISIGHTHGNVREEIKKKSLAANLPQDLIDMYGIRTTGLNISISDIWQHEYYKKIAEQMTEGRKQIFQTVIMYNGDFITINSDTISKSNDVKVQGRNDVIISTGTEIQNQEQVQYSMSEQQIGKATVDTLITKKNEAQRQVTIDEQEIEQGEVI